MHFELIFIVLIFCLSLAALFTNSKKALYILLPLSVLLHKELFSIYAWNILPVRVFMGALTVFVFVTVVKRLRTAGLTDFRRQLTDPAAVFLGAFLVIAGISIIFSKNLQASLSVYAFLVTIFALYFFLNLVYLGDKFAVLKSIKIYILIGFILSLIGFIQIWVYKDFNFIFGAFWNVPGHMPRIGSLFWDVNHFAGLLVLLLPIAWVLVLTSPWKQKLFFLIASISMSITLVLTNARSGWIAMGLATVVFVLLLVYRKFRYKGLGVVAALIMIFFGLVLWQYMDKQSPIRREIRQYFHYRLDSFDSHFLLLTGAWQVFDKYPILGGGYGSFYEHFAKAKISATFFARDPAALNTRVPAHSIWGELLAETGVVGFSLMLGFYMTVVATLVYTALRSKHKVTTLLTSAMAGSVMGMLIAGVFYSYNSEFFWLALFMYFFYALYSIRTELAEITSRLWSSIYSYFVSNPKFPPVLLVIMSLGLIFVNLGVNKLIPYDEAIYAKVSQNILTTGDWLTLSWRIGQPWFEKPPLYFWLSAISLSVLPNLPELAVRLPSALFGLLSVLVTYFFGKRLFGKTAGFVSGLCLVTTFHFLYYARTGMLDVTCSFFILVALYLYYTASKDVSKLKLIFAGLFVGLAVLTKGVVGFLPLVVIFGYEVADFVLLALKTKRFPVRSLGIAGEKLVVVFLTSALVFLPWHVVMYKLHGQTFIDSYLGYHVLNRATLETEDKTGPIYWYLIVLKVSMRLWFVALIPALLFAVLKLIKSKTNRSGLFMAMLWAIVVLAGFSLAKSKLVWYITPIYPAVALLVGYFYSSVLNFLDGKLSKFNYISSFFLKTGMMYLTACVALMYLFVNKGLVYTGDLTGAQVQMMQTKARIYGLEPVVYLDRIEVPLAMFYAGDNFVITDFTPLKAQLSESDKAGNRLLFITKESRFNQLQKSYPTIKLVDAKNEWRLGELVAK